MTTFTIAYSDTDEAVARKLAGALADADVALGEIETGGMLLAVVSPLAVKDPDFNNTIARAVAIGADVVLLETTPTDLPEPLKDFTRISMDGNLSIEQLLSIAADKRQDGLSLTARNLRQGVGIGLGLLALFGFYTWAIVVFDIEAPAEEFERAYTRSAATVNAFAQPFIPQSTEQAEAFEITLQSRQISDELATVVVGTATQAAADGGFTPMPTGMIVAPVELSEVRQTATGGAILRATQTAGADELEFESIAATATQAAIEANAELEAGVLTVTAGAELNQGSD
jgi:hypothetical protein